MKAVCWFGRNDVRVDTVSDPKVLSPRDCILRVTSAAICGSDLHLYGGYAGGQAEFARVPFADYNAFKVPDGVEDEQVLFLSDIFPTGWQAAERAEIRGGDVVAVWGCGPVGQFALRSALLMGADRVIAIDRFPERLPIAAE